MKHTKVWAIALTILVLGMMVAPASLADNNRLPSLDTLKDSGAVLGVVFQDWDQNGEWDEFEPGLGDATVALYGLDGSLVAEVVTDIDGVFAFEGVQPGAYMLVELDPLGYSSSTENEVKLVVRAGDVAEAAFGDILLLGGTAPSALNSDSALVIESAAR